MTAPPPLSPPPGGRLPATPEAWLPREHTLYRPRHSRRQRTALVCAFVFFLTPTLAFVFGARPQAFENRALRDFPSPAAGWGFFTELSGWATDHLTLRRAGVQAAEGISTALFGDPPGSAHPAPSGPAGVNTGPPPQDADGPTGEERRAAYPVVISGKDGWLYLGQDVSYKCRPVQDLDQVIGVLQRLRAVVESSGRRFELVVAPDKSTAAPQFLPDDFAGKTCARRQSDRFWQRMTTEVGIVDVRAGLQEAARRVNRPIYDAVDTHWSYEGGLVMTRALAERLRPGVTSTWKVSPTGQRSWPADIPPLVGRSATRDLTGYALAPDGRQDRTSYVASDFRMPLSLEQSRPAGTTGTVGASVGMIADSFSQFATPFLAATFQDLTIVHPETVADDPAGSAAELLRDRDVVVVELAERHLVGGASPLLRTEVIDQIGRVLATHPR
ncbi:SGNH hydrolase-like domain-containing protein, acetyltransferase AlgX [Amycolatopsis arida]|uniref:SGNH hydrolase-like domain-containing protein, acetyltransferase AlgX n=1 Tax=Amycolatopsis arida TaxID=587909 RepID=A0A1I5U0L7_9PSEU|nr:hypothetical protein [Amycolatopsis arida]TDX95878.1 acetyltransferase AlgX (SGNH hydrolase-like protein) [Amycolatopsis arida]SFP88721.1 SGNH hydrolase-like domain-containing protein, acetyltransferase AlgX [Amycolatopsis arida]